MILLTAQPNEKRYVWEVILYLESVKNIYWEEKAHVLVYCKTPKRKEWEIAEKLFPNANFFYYNSDPGVINLSGPYPPIIRLFAIKEHWKKYPELEKETIFYTDSDIIFTSQPDIEKFLHDDINYVSNTVVPNDYMSHKYFESKVNQVDIQKLPSYQKRNILKELAHQVGVNYQTIIDNYSNTGGAQYLLKNLSTEFWENAYNHTFMIRMHLMNANQNYFPGATSAEREKNGFQSWCADMWSVLWNLWREGRNTYCPIELDFAWATDKSEKLQQVSILHNAGIVSNEKFRIQGTNQWVEKTPFHKGKAEYMTGAKTPFTDLEYVAEAAEIKDFCTGVYAQHILDVQKKYNLNF